MSLLPPKVVGPINGLSPQVTVVGTGPGATVQLFADGISFGPATVASGPSVVVPLGRSGRYRGRRSPPRRASPPRQASSRRLRSSTRRHPSFRPSCF